MQKYYKLFTLFFIVGLVSCSAAPTRDNTKEFKSLAKGQIVSESILDFSSCIHDGFNKSHSILTNVDIKQQTRSEGYRVEAFGAGRILLVSVDILKSGHVELWESSSALFINTSEERTVFRTCLGRYTAK